MQPLCVNPLHDLSNRSGISAPQRPAASRNSREPLALWRSLYERTMGQDIDRRSRSRADAPSRDQ